MLLKYLFYEHFYLRHRLEKILRNNTPTGQKSNCLVKNLLMIFLAFEQGFANTKFSGRTKTAVQFSQDSLPWPAEFRGESGTRWKLVNHGSFSVWLMQRRLSGLFTRSFLISCLAEKVTNSTYLNE